MKRKLCQPHLLVSLPQREEATGTPLGDIHTDSHYFGEILGQWGWQVPCWSPSSRLFALGAYLTTSWLTLVPGPPRLGSQLWEPSSTYQQVCTNLAHPPWPSPTPASSHLSWDPTPGPAPGPHKAPQSATLGPRPTHQMSQHPLYNAGLGGHPYLLSHPR